MTPYRPAWRALLALILIALFISPPGAARADGPDPAVQAVIDAVDPAALDGYLQDLSGARAVSIGGITQVITTRSSLNVTATDKVVRFAAERLGGLGLSIELPAYLFYGTKRSEVVAEQPGLTDPGCVYLVGAHIDDALENGPGADDNGSGSAAVLALAGVLSQRGYACSIRYALFTGEEWGLYGSAAYAQTLHRQGVDLRGVLNLDMIGYNTPANGVLELHARPVVGSASPDQPLADTFTGVVTDYSIPLTPLLKADGMGRSDHASFWANGFPALLAIEDEQNFNPWYHSVNDSLAYINPAYHLNVTRAAAGVIATLAGPLPAAVVFGTLRDSVTGQGLPGAVVTAAAGAELWSTITDGDGRYLLRLPPGDSTLTFAAAGYLDGLPEAARLVDGQRLQLDRALVTAPGWQPRLYIPLLVLD